MRQLDVYFNQNAGRSCLGGFEEFNEFAPGIIYLCTATPEEIDDEIYKRERVNREYRFAFEDLGIDRLDEISNMFEKSVELFKAAATGNEIKVAELLAAGADPNYQDEGGKTPLMVAAKNGYESRFGVVELLVNAGAAVCIEDDQGLQALDYANEVASDESWSPYIAEFLEGQIKTPVVIDSIVRKACERAEAPTENVRQEKEVEFGR